MNVEHHVRVTRDLASEGLDFDHRTHTDLRQHALDLLPATSLLVVFEEASRGEETAADDAPLDPFRRVGFDRIPSSERPGGSDQLLSREGIFPSLETRAGNPKTYLALQSEDNSLFHLPIMLLSGQA